VFTTAPFHSDPQAGIRVEYDVLNILFGKQVQDGLAQFPSQLRFEPAVLVVLENNRSRHCFFVRLWYFFY